MRQARTWGVSAMVAATLAMGFPSAMAASRTYELTMPAVPARTADTAALTGLRPVPGSDRAAFTTAALMVDDASRWRDATPPGQGAIAAAGWSGESHAWVLRDEGRGMAVWRSADAGLSWSRVGTLDTPEGGSLAMSFAGTDDGWVIARETSTRNFSFGRLYRTSNGGATWQALPRPPAAGEIAFLNARDGFLLGGASGNDLYATRDGGRSWSRVALAGDVMAATLPHAVRAGIAEAGVIAMVDGALTLSLLEIDFSGTDAVVRSLAHGRLQGTAPRLLAAGAEGIVLSGEVVVADAGALPAIRVDRSGTLAAWRGGWAMFADGTCQGFKAGCAQTTRLASVAAGATLKDATAAVVTALRVPVPAVPQAAVQSNHRGFDKCTAASVADMQKWWTASPYRDANIYIGGNNRGCTQANLNAAWVAQIFAQGWQLIPTWVGPQSPSASGCPNCKKLSTDAVTARQQGSAEADLAANAAEALGLPAPTVIYYDMEAYDNHTAAETEFINGWIERLRARGHVPAMYVHWRNVLAYSALANPLEGVWIPRWSGSGGTAPANPPSPNSINGVADSIFANRRIFQYYANTNETYGGATFNIDNNIANGLVAAAPVAPVNATGIWWNPAESGWGINLNQQGNTLFATLFDYDAAGQGMWLVMSAGTRTADGASFTGDLYRTSGPAFNANPFTPLAAGNVSAVGKMTVTFANPSTATLSYTVNGTAVTKAIAPQVFGSRAATCVNTAASRAALTNYQDLWWNPAESGWGLNIAHQDNTIFATLFTYEGGAGAANPGMWLVMASGQKQADGSYVGELYRTTGPAFNAVPFSPAAVNVTVVGSMRLTFQDGASGTLTYTVNGTTVTKAIQRQVFGAALPACG